jgi:hypothetical protein
MTLRKVIACIAGAFAAGFLVGEFASIPGAHAQTGFQIRVQGVGDPHANKPINLQGSKVVGFACADGTCYIATQ